MPLTRAARAIAATCLFSSRRASSLAYDARFRSKVDGLVARRRGDLLVVLEDCTDPANAASIARVCDGFGVPELLFVTSRAPAPKFDPCGCALRRNQLQRATRHRRDVGPVNASARWRGTHWFISAQPR